VVSAKLFQELTRLGEAVVELPLAAMRRFADADGERKAQEAGWKAYDTWVRAISAATDALYDSEAFGAAAGRWIESGLKWQRLSSAAAGAFFGALWPAIGLPTAAEMTELRAELRALRDEAAAARLEAAEARAAQPVLPPAAGEHPTNESLAAMWNGWIAQAPYVNGREGGDASAN